MRYAVGSALLVAAIFAAAASGPDGLDTDARRTGYSIGYQIGDDFRRQGLALDPDLLVRGVLDALQDADPLLTREEMDRALIVLKSRAGAASERIKEEDRAFLAGNAGREGVKVLPSGLQYEILEAGTGESPEASDTVTIRYRGTLADGTEFDSSFGRAEPDTFVVGDSIPAWREALRLMRAGARWRLFVPPELGYGERAPRGVGPDRAVIFEIELISLAKAD